MTSRPTKKHPRQATGDTGDEPIAAEVIGMTTEDTGGRGLEEISDLIDLYECLSRDISLFLNAFEAVPQRYDLV